MLIVLMALSWPSQIGTAVRIRRTDFREDGPADDGLRDEGLRAARFFIAVAAFRRVWPLTLLARSWRRSW
jgi:hypothetical protein